MAQRKLYNYLVSTDFMGIRTKIKKFVKNKRMTKGNNTK